MQHMKIVATAVAVLVGVALSTGTAVAGKGMFALGHGNIANGESIYFNGKGDAPACSTCHMEDGTGNDAMGSPRIKGQFFTFLWKQLEDFAADRRMDQTMFVMNANAKALSQQDRIDVATYLASQNVDFMGSDLDALREQGIEVGQAHLGKAIVEYGSPVRADGYPSDLGSPGVGLPACKSCHGFAGRGAPPVYPMIGLQRYTYLVKQLEQWRDGSRANDKMHQMQAVAQRLSDEDIRNVATYLTNANPLTIGNFQTPYDWRFDYYDK